MSGLTTNVPAGAAGIVASAAPRALRESVMKGSHFAGAPRDAPDGYAATIEPATPVTTGQVGTWTLAITVGEFGILPGGGVAIVPPRSERARWEVGHVVAWSNRVGAALRVELQNCQPLVLHHAQYPVIYAFVEGAPVLPGDTIWVRLGDRGGYVNGRRAVSRACEWPLEEAVFEVGVDPEGTTRYTNRRYPTMGGAWLPVPNPPQLKIRAGPPVRLQLAAASTPAPGDDLRLAIHAQDKYGNLADSYAGTLCLETECSDIVLPATAVLRPEDMGARRVEGVAWQGTAPDGRSAGAKGRAAGTLRFYTISARDPNAGANGIIGRSNPIAPGFGMADLGYQAYFGELHSHCGLSGDGYRPIDYAYRYARDAMGLDFCSLTDHEGGRFWNENWAETVRAAREFNRPGQFVTFVGYEYGGDLSRGHRNVIYLDGDGTHPSPKDCNLLWDLLPAGRALVIPHHPNTHSESGLLLGKWRETDWSVHDDRFQRLVEITQLRGSFERDTPDGNDVVLGGRGAAVQNALARGCRVGFVGGTDNHRGHPGSRLDHMGGVDPEELVCGGWTAVWATDLTREAIFAALYGRRCYATTGARILVDFRVNDQPMGSELTRPADGAVRVLARVIGSAPLATIEVVRNNVLVYRFEAGGVQAAAFEWEDHLGSQRLLDEVALPDGATYYYLRVRQEDGERAWASPVWVG